MGKWLTLIEEFREVSLKQGFLDARLNAETKARNLLNTKLSCFNKNDLGYFLELCNTERVPRNTHTNNLRDNNTYTRFQLSFIGANKNNIWNSLDEFNKSIPMLWKANDDMKELELFWENSNIKGAGIGLPTMVLYLKNPIKYNVWIPFLSEALGIFVERKFNTAKNVSNYMNFNKTLIDFLQRMEVHPSFLPQEIDYILYRIGQC